MRQVNQPTARLLILIVYIFIAGCAAQTTEIQTSGLDSTNAAKIYIYRTDIFYSSGSPEKPFVFLDDQLLGKLGTGDTIHLFVAPGTHTVSAKDSAFMMQMQEIDRLQVYFKPGETYYFRCSIDFSHVLQNAMYSDSSFRQATKKEFDEKS